MNARRSKAKKTSKTTGAASGSAKPLSREALGYVDLVGLTLDEIRAMGREKFEKLIEEAIEADRKRRYAAIDAQLEAAARMRAEGCGEQADTMLRECMRSMSDDVARQQAIARKFARMVFGSRSERLDREELRQLCLAFGVSEADWNAAELANATPSIPVPPAPEETQEAHAAETASSKKKRPNHRGRRPLALAPSVAIIETEVKLEGAERLCIHCGLEKEAFGFVRHERIEIVPARLECHVERREVCTCKACRRDAVTAPRTDEDRTRRRVGNSIVADLIAEKCSEAQPVHRQRERYRRLGWTAPASTLDSAWRWGTDLLDPIADVVRGEVLRESYGQADSTTLTVLDPLHPNGRFRAQVWTFVSKAGVAFDLTPTWEAQAIAPSFAVNWDAFRQVDDYKGYGSVVEVEGMKRQLVPEHLRLGCMMHVRRRFHEAFEAKDLRAAVPLELIRRIYDVEGDAKGLAPDARLALRTERSLPILAELRTWLDAHADEPPKSLLGGAVRYARDQWVYIERCFSRGEFEIDNGAPEREIRSIAIGRRNFLFSGSVEAARRLTGAYTLVVNAKRLGIDPFTYLRDVLDQLERGFAVNRVAELTPARYTAAKAAQ